jgi:ABC-type phosphate/phosphonate transport system permease subunit
MPRILMLAGAIVFAAVLAYAITFKRVPYRRSFSGRLLFAERTKSPFWYWLWTGVTALCALGMLYVFFRYPN